jgi:hypothetical protein
MEKQAQKLGPLTKAREWINRPGEKLMSMWSPEFGELIQKLHEVDDKVREIAIGDEEGGGLKDLLKLAKTNFNRRGYGDALKFLGQFHTIMEDISNTLKSLETAVEVKHNDFLFSEMDPEDIEYLTQKLGPKFKAKKVKQQIKAAGVMDWWNIMRGNVAGGRAAWERSFPKKAKEIKKGIATLLSRSETLLTNLLATLKVLGSYRATRKLEDYLKLSEKFIQRYNQYDTTFATVYNESLSKLVDMQVEKMKPKDESPFQPAGIPSKERTKPVEHPGPGFNPFQHLIDVGKKKEEEEEMRKVQSGQSRTPYSLVPSSKPVPTPPTNPEPTSKESIQSVHSSDILPETPEIEQTKVSPKFVPPKEKPILVSNHQDFISKIASLETDSPFIVATELILYADKIKEADPETSDKLTQLSQKLLAE